MAAKLGAGSREQNWWLLWEPGMEPYEKLCTLLLFYLGPYQTMEMLHVYFTTSEYSINYTANV